MDGAIALGNPLPLLRAQKHPLLRGFPGWPVHFVLGELGLGAAEQANHDHMSFDGERLQILGRVLAAVVHGRVHATNGKSAFSREQAAVKFAP